MRIYKIYLASLSLYIFSRTNDQYEAYCVAEETNTFDRFTSLALTFACDPISSINNKLDYSNA